MSPLSVYLVGASAATGKAVKTAISATTMKANYVTLATADELIRDLSVTADYILDADGQKIENELEDEVYYPFLVVLEGSEERRPGFTKGLIESRFRQLNPVVIEAAEGKELEKGLTVALEEIAALNAVISKRMNRMQAWIGFRDKELPTFSSMTRMVEQPVPAALAREYSNYIAERIDHISMLEFLSHPEDDSYYLEALNQWDFPAYRFGVDELLYCAYLIVIEPFLTCCGKKQGDKEASNRLLAFLFHIRDNYRLGNPFHNFRHAVDVLQATNFYLNTLKKEKWDVQFTEEERFALLLAALGHDFGHPATTNQVLTQSEAPIAALFHNESTLENYHQVMFLRSCKPFLEGFTKHVGQDGTDAVEKLVSTAILATDMAKHDHYVKEIDNFNDPGNFKYQMRYDRMQMLASLLIKCADISNVCRPLQTSVKWALSLGQEFKQVAQLLQVLERQTTEMDVTRPPYVIKEMTAEKAVQQVGSLSSSQMFFIDRFATEFFTKISETIPPLHFLADQLKENKKYWTNDLMGRK